MDFTTIFSQHRTRNIFFALVAFIISFIVYFLTVAPTASFWDPAEYIAISHSLQIAHPPGSPFFALWGRLFSMFMPTEYVAISVNMISVLTSALSVMLLYLIIVRLIQEWKGPAEAMSQIDLTGLYAGGLFGALTFAVTHTQWFNAVEAEMYASSMFFTALVVWGALRWSEKPEDPHSDRWLIVIAYLFGLGIGVHLLNLLALFFVAMIIYFKKREFTILSFVGMAAISILAFLFIYPFTIIQIPDLADNIRPASYGLIGPITYLVLIVIAVIFGLYYTHKHKMRTANLAMLAYAVIIIGYSSFALVFIRSNAEPAIDENDPSTLEAFVSYLKREQYGETPLLSGFTYDNQINDINNEEEAFFPRRHSSIPDHLDYYANFDSDWQFFWQYQVNHMYLRYFNWNFIGREADVTNTGWYSGFGETPYSHNPANSGYFYLPLLFGILGFIYHFRNDWKRALSILALFVLTGLAIIFYLNQTPIEPRERDYAYVGSFFAFSIWIGLGSTALIEILKQKVSDQRFLAYGVLALSFLAVPIWMAKENWPSHDRSLNYVARDYAYNLLSSVEPNSILFTNGDNDTFPLWYLQEVEGYRTDVRVVCLSLLNTDWYIKQLRDRQTHESLPLPIRMTDEEIEELTSVGGRLYDPGQITIPVNLPLLESAFSGEAVPDSLTGIERDQTFEYQYQSATPYSIPVDSLDNEVQWFLQGRFIGQDQQGNQRYYLQTQDILILDILRNNNWLRPVYFANTVSNTGQLSMHNYFQFEGKAFRVVPKQREVVNQFGFIDPDVHISRIENFRFEEWNNPDNYLDENIRRMLTNYRYGFIFLADKLIEQDDYERASYWLEFGEDHIPFSEHENNWTIPSLYAYKYAQAQSPGNAAELTEFLTEKIMYWLDWQMKDLNNLNLRIRSLEAEATRARAEAQMDRYQRLNSQLQNLTSELQSHYQNVITSRSNLIILQGVYFMTDMDEQAIELAQEANLITNGIVPMPTTREENEEMIQELGI